MLRLRNSAKNGWTTIPRLKTLHFSLCVCSCFLFLFFFHFLSPVCGLFYCCHDQIKCRSIVHERVVRVREVRRSRKYDVRHCRRHSRRLFVIILFSDLEESSSFHSFAASRAFFTVGDAEFEVFFFCLLSHSVHLTEGEKKNRWRRRNTCALNECECRQCFWNECQIYRREDRIRRKIWTETEMGKLCFLLLFLCAFSWLSIL